MQLMCNALTATIISYKLHIIINITKMCPDNTVICWSCISLSSHLSEQHTFTVSRPALAVGQVIQMLACLNVQI